MVTSNELSLLAGIAYYWRVLLEVQAVRGTNSKRRNGQFISGTTCIPEQLIPVLKASFTFQYSFTNLRGHAVGVSSFLTPLIL
jgi:hypothetical protein